MSNVENESPREAKRRRKDALRQSFHQIPDGWVCDECGALTPQLDDAEKHLAWHAKHP